MCQNDEQFLKILILYIKFQKMSAVEKQGGNRVAKTPKPRWQLDFSSRFVKILNEMVFLFQSWRMKYMLLLFILTGLIKT